MVKVWPAARVGIRIAPVSPANDIADSNPAAIFGHLVAKLSERKIGYIHVVEGATQGDRNIAPFDWRALRRAFSGAYIANNGYTREMADTALDAGNVDLVAFGRPFIANPDLVERLRRGASSRPAIAPPSTAAASRATPTIRRSARREGDGRAGIRTRGACRSSLSLRFEELDAASRCPDVPAPSAEPLQTKKSSTDGRHWAPATPAPCQQGRGEISN